MNKILILQRKPEDQKRIEEAIKKICPEVWDTIVMHNDLDKKTKEMIKAQGNFFKKEKKPMLVVTGSVLLTIGGKRVVKKIKNWNPTAEILVYSYSNLEDKRIKMFMLKEDSTVNAEKLAKYVKEYVATHQN